MFAWDKLSQTPPATFIDAQRLPFLLPFVFAYSADSMDGCIPPLEHSESEPLLESRAVAGRIVPSDSVTQHSVTSALEGQALHSGADDGEF